MSLIRLHLNRFGHLELAFVNARILRRVLARVVKNGGPAHRTAYLQHDSDVNELLDRLPVSKRKDLQNGWDVKVQMDGWEAAHYYGYDALCGFQHNASYDSDRFMRS